MTAISMTAISMTTRRLPELFGRVSSVILAAAFVVVSCGSSSDVGIRVTTTETGGTEPPASATSGRQPETPPPAAAGPARDAPRLVGHFVPVIVERFAHDETAWTQGLEWYDGRLLESTGRYGESSLRLVDPETGETELLLPIDDDLYAEGITVVNDQAIQLTYKEETLVRTSLADDARLSTPQRQPGAYDGPGWGLCFNGSELVMSDGTDELRFRDPDSFEVTRSIRVLLDGEPVERLNELECIGDQVFANVWLTHTIVAIDARSGTVEASIDASGLVPPGYEDTDDAVLNGIAYNEERGTFWLTGKLWPVLYEVTLAPR